MKKILSTIGGLAFAIALGYAQECDLQVQVVQPTPEMCGGSQSVAKHISSKLLNALTASGVSADENYGQFYVTAKFDDSYRETVPGPPMSTVVHTTMTLMLADILGNKVFDSETFELRGVGTSPERAYLNAMSQLGKNNETWKNFLSNAQKKMLKYFDKNYPQLLAKASKAAAKRDYEEALYFSSLIPECCVGYDEAERDMLKYWQGYINDEGLNLLNQAKSAFALSPNAQGAAEAFGYINSIHPSSSAYPAAMKFADEVKKQTKAEYDFEVHKKYEDKMDVTRRTIDAARQIGVAYGNGQKSSTTNILWK